MDRIFAFWGFKHRHLFEFLDPRLGFRGFGSVVAEFVNECLQMSTLGHLVFILAFGRLAPLFFGSVKGVEISAFVIVETLRVLVDYVRRYFIQEGSVVGDDEKGARVRLEVAGEESDGGDVQHVGRFCEVSVSTSVVFLKMLYRQGEAGLVRKRGLWPMPVSSSNLRKRFWWHNAAFPLRSPGLPGCLQHETRPCPTPSRKALNECR